MYYVFLAVVTIFSNTIRDTHHPHAREDLQSLNMAATFFATLIPGDGQRNYVGFITRMCTNLERIARTVVEKNEKLARDPDSKDKERRPPATKRQGLRATSASTSKQQRQSRTTAARQPINPSAQAPSTTTHTHLPDISIPETIEGLPPVNSSGYVVPMSPGDDSQNANSSVSNNVPTSARTDYTTRGRTLEATTSSITSNYSTATSQIDQIYTTTTSPQSNTLYSNNSATSTSTIPEFWQIPLTAEWELGNNMWAGLFPTVYDLAQQMNQSIPTPETASSMPILSAESFLQGAPATNTSAGAGFSAEDLGYYNSFAPPSMSPSEAQAAEQAWPSGFLGLY